MKKPALLRAYLLERTPWFNDDPTRLITLVKNGHVVATGDGSSFKEKKSVCYEHQYTLDIMVLDFPGDPEEINIPMLEWLETHQVDKMHNPEFQRQGISFDAEIIDTEKIDYRVSVTLTERIIAHVKDEDATISRERYAVESADEPQFDELFKAIDPSHGFLHIDKPKP